MMFAMGALAAYGREDENVEILVIPDYVTIGGTSFSTAYTTELQLLYDNIGRHLYAESI